MPGNGNGTFGTASVIKLLPSLALSLSSARLSTADLNSDGHLDLTLPGLSNVASIFMGAGDGTFEQADGGEMLPSVKVFDTLAADFDNDGHNDVVSADQQNGNIIFNTISKAGAVTGTISFATGGSLGGILSADFDGDGRTDVVGIDESNGMARVMLNRTAGTAIYALDTARRTLKIQGTSLDDNIKLDWLHTQLVITRNGQTAMVSMAEYDAIRIYGRLGNDVMDASLYSGPVYMDGSSGNDTLIGGSGNDRLRGFIGNDLIKGNGGNDRLEGWKGNDIVLGGDGDDRIYGYEGHDSLEGGGGRDRLYGELGNDSLLGGASNDRLYGGEGDDWLFGNAGTDGLDGGLGNDKGDYGVGEMIYSIENLITSALMLKYKK